MGYTPVWKKRLILLVGLLENLIFTGSILGWSALNHMLKQEGIFEHHCYWQESNSSSSLPITIFRSFNNSVVIPVRTGADPLPSENGIPLNSNGSVLDFDNNGTDEDDSANVSHRTSSQPELAEENEEESLPNLEEEKNDTKEQKRRKRQTQLEPVLNARMVTERILPESDNKEENEAIFSELDNDDAKDQATTPAISVASAIGSNTKSSSSSFSNLVRICKKQDTILNLAFTIGSFLNGFTAFIWGFLLDRWGLRAVRLVINSFLTTGCLLLCFTNKENSYLIFPAVSLLCLGGVPLRIADMQFANLFPNRRSSVITFYSGAFSASSIIFVILKYVYEMGVSFQGTCSLMVLASLLMLPATFFLLPADRVQEDDPPKSTCKSAAAKLPAPSEFRNPTYREPNLGSLNPDELKFTRSRFSQLYQQNLSSVQPIITLQKFNQLSSPSMKRRAFQDNNYLEKKENGWPVLELPGGGDTFLNTIHHNQMAYESSSDFSGNDLKANQLNLNQSLLQNAIKEGKVTEKELLARIELIKSNLIADAVKPIVPDSKLNASTDELPLSLSLSSFAYLLHQWWFSWLITYMIMYVGSMGLWIGRITVDVHKASSYLKIYGLLQVLSLIIAPLAGLLMDRQVAAVKCEPDPFLRRLRMARSGFWPMMITTLSLTGILLCKLFDHETAIYISIVFNTLLRSFLVAVATAYLRIRFPAEHFNKLLGIMSTVGAFVTLLQFPLFILESSPDTVFWVHLFNAFCTLLAFLNPILLLVNPLQRSLVHKEQEREAKFRTDSKTMKS